MSHFQPLDLSDIVIAIDNSPNFEFVRRDPDFADGSLIIDRGEWTVKHHVQRKIWAELGFGCVNYKKNSVFVNPINLSCDQSSVGFLLELLGKPSYFKYSKHASIILRYDKLHGPNKVEETYISLTKHGRPPWLLNRPERINEIKEFITNYSNPAAVLVDRL